MREIKFRGKRTDNGEWVHGSLIIDYITDKQYIHTVGNSVNESDKLGQEGCLYIVSFEVDPATVGQYTGLKDKNGVEIYEGDILRLWRSVGSNGELRGEHIPLPVVYDNLWCQFFVLNKPLKEQHGILQQFGAFVVMGNIHDNPQLLEV